MTCTPQQLEVRRIGTIDPRTPCLVFLHEGLGSVSMWRDFPDRLAQACGLPAMIYSRHGYGRSPVFEAPLAPDFMHRAAEVELPALLRHCGIGPTILVGHSDGGSIALLHAASTHPSPLGVIVLAPHLFVEPVCTVAIAAVANDYSPQSRLGRSLARHHRDATRTFETWSNAWLAPEFGSWNIEQQMAALACPVLAIQGLDDAYGTMRQIRRLRELHADTCLLELAQCGHSPHLDQPEAVLQASTAFINALTAQDSR